MKFVPKNRWQAFGVHLLISLVLFLVLASVIFFLWYPGFLFLYDGGLQGMKLIASVDFIIGPILTLCVYKLGKKSLRFDLSCIAIFQILCLVGGMWTVWQTRPVAIVYASGGFTVINMQGFEREKINLNDVPLVQKASWPVWLAVDASDADAEMAATVWSIMGSSFAYNTENYIPFDEMLTRLPSAGVSYEQIAKKLNLEQENIFDANVSFYPVVTSMFDGYLALDTETGAVKDFYFKDVNLFEWLKGL